MINLQNFSPCLLLAMPQLMDPNFHRSVVLLVDFQSTGALGIVVNRPLELTLGAVQAPDIKIAEQYRAAPLWYGGPVNSQQALLLAHMHAALATDLIVKPLEEGLVVVNPLAMLVGYESAALAEPFKIVVGYAGWSAKQLDEEIAGGSWLVAPLTEALIFSDAETMWERSVRSIGVDPVALQAPPSGMKQ